jgi:hypothetical protein
MGRLGGIRVLTWAALGEGFLKKRSQISHGRLRALARLYCFLAVAASLVYRFEKSKPILAGLGFDRAEKQVLKKQTQFRARPVK